MTNFYGWRCSVSKSARFCCYYFTKWASGKAPTDLGWELGGGVAGFLKTTQAAPDSSAGPQKAGQKIVGQLLSGPENK